MQQWGKLVQATTEMTIQKYSLCVNMWHLADQSLYVKTFVQEIL